MPKPRPINTPKELAGFGQKKAEVLPHQVNGAAQASRPIMTELSRKVAPTAAAVSFSPNARAGVTKILRPELPVRAAVSKVERSPVLSRVTKKANVAPLAERVREGINRRAPEQPRHADVIKRSGNAKGPISAEHNRRLKRDDAIKRATPTRQIVATASPAPADIANGLLTPNRGLVTTHTLPFKVGTPQAMREATPEALDEINRAKDSPVVLTLPETVVVAEPKNNPNAMDGSGEGIGRLVFLGGAVFVAWLVFKGAA